MSCASVDDVVPATSDVVTVKMNDMETLVITINNLLGVRSTTGAVNPLLIYFWTNVIDGVPTFNQQWVNIY